jgi:cardiolipin synthase
VEPGAGRGRQVAGSPPPGTGGPEPGPPDSGPITLANLLTSVRLFLAPVFLVLYVRGDTARALLVFAIAAATDLLDGLMARLLHEHSRIGEIIDPIADKLLAFCALVALAANDRLPVWLPALVVGRDAATLLGAAALQATGRVVPIRPTRAGKYATFAVAVLVLLELGADLDLALATAAGPWLPAIALLAAACVTVSLVQYAWMFTGLLRTAPAEQSR